MKTSIPFGRVKGSGDSGGLLERGVVFFFFFSLARSRPAGRGEELSFGGGIQES